MNDITQFPDLGARLSQKIIGSAIEVHRQMGPGLLEKIYEECLAIQMEEDGLAFEKQKSLPVMYKGINLGMDYKADFIVEDKIIIELKAVEKMQPLYEAQLLTYMKLSRISLGLLMNFNTVLLKDGIKRMALGGKD